MKINKGVGIVLIYVGGAVLITIMFVLLYLKFKNNTLLWVYGLIVASGIIAFVLLKIFGKNGGGDIVEKKTDYKEVWEHFVDEVAESGELDGCVFNDGKLIKYNKKMIYPLGNVIPVEKNGLPHVFFKFYKGCKGIKWPMGVHSVYIALDDINNVSRWNFDFYPFGHGLVYDFKKHFGGRLIKKSFEADPQRAWAIATSELLEEDPDLLKKKLVNSVKPIQQNMQGNNKSVQQQVENQNVVGDNDVD